MLRYVVIVLFAAAGVLALANLLAFAHARDASAPAVTGGPVTLRQRWHALPVEDRLRLVETYRDTVSRENARGILSQARQFAQLPPPRQEFLRRLYEVLVETLDKQPPARRSELLHYPPSARAYFVYQFLAAGDPQTLSELTRLSRSASER